MASKLEPTNDPSQVAGVGITPVYANRFSITMNANTTRIACGEFIVGNPDTDTIYHTVLVAPTSDAVTLAKLIQEVFSQVQAAQVVASVPPPKSEGSNA
jgi:hypothetical protein